MGQLLRSGACGLLALLRAASCSVLAGLLCSQDSRLARGARHATAMLPLTWRGSCLSGLVTSSGGQQAPLLLLFLSQGLLSLLLPPAHSPSQGVSCVSQLHGMLDNLLWEAKGCCVSRSLWLFQGWESSEWMALKRQTGAVPEPLHAA